MGTLVDMKGYKYNLTITDYFTKWFKLTTIRTKSGEEVGMALFKLMTQYGYPDIIISDQGTYVSKLETVIIYVVTVIIIISSIYSINVNHT